MKKKGLKVLVVLMVLVGLGVLIGDFKKEKLNQNFLRIANPASVYCRKQGGSVEIKTASDGSQTGWCVFKADGRECEEWDFYRTKVCETKPSLMPTEGFQQVSFEESRKTAENFVKTSPTFKFDGFDLKFEDFKTLRCPYCWEFIFSFSCRHPGYGNRTGQILVQVITSHKISVVVKEGKIEKAIIDEKYDELKQELLE